MSNEKLDLWEAVPHKPKYVTIYPCLPSKTSFWQPGQEGKVRFDGSLHALADESQARSATPSEGVRIVVQVKFEDGQLITTEKGRFFQLNGPEVWARFVDYLK